MSRFVLGPGAVEDFDQIWDYIAEDSVEAANRWMERLIEGFQLLADNPAIGHSRADLTAGPYLFWPVDKYLIMYRTNDSEVEIVAVTRGGRDIPQLLKDRFA